MKWLALALCLVGCAQSKPKPTLGSASAAPRTPPSAVVSAGLSSPSAFELVARPEGLQLLWATAAPGAGWLSEVELSHSGAPRRQPRSLALPPRMLGRVTDLAASYVGAELALAWLEQSDREARAMAAVITGREPAELLDLGSAALTADSARGNIALVAETEQQRALVMWRGLSSPCIEPQSSPCVGFSFRRLRPGIAEASGIPLSVPVPCASHSVQLAVSPGRFHYGVCTREGADALTTMFSIQHEPPYARAEPLLKGCSPLGSLLLAGAPWLVADCHGKRRAVPIPLADEKVQFEAIDAPKITCTPERAELRQGRFVLGLREPRAGLEAALPSSFVPTGGRAGWTGKSLLVAFESGGQLQTRVHVCRGGTLSAP